MKKLFLVLCGMTFTTLLAGCGTKVDVVDYNDKLVDFTNQCFNAEGAIRSTMGENPDLAKTLYSTAVDTCKTSQTAVAAMDAYEDDTTLRDGIDILLQSEIAYLEKFGETIIYRDYEELTADQEETYTILETELFALEQAVNTVSENLLTIQEIFAAKHGYDLV